MSWIFISPHIDDVALSCGGFVWEKSQLGQNVSVWTICAGNPPPGKISNFAEKLHARWNFSADAVELRVKEDIISCNIMGAAHHHFSIPDCIYRRSTDNDEPLYTTEESLYGEIVQNDRYLIEKINKEISLTLDQQFHQSQKVEVVCPLGIGNHVDHTLTRAAVDHSNLATWYYADYPYILDNNDAFDKLISDGWTSSIFPITDAGIHAWGQAIAAHTSQFNTFWSEIPEMKADILRYVQNEQGIRLWQTPQNACAEIKSCIKI